MSETLVSMSNFVSGTGSKLGLACAASSPNTGTRASMSTATSGARFAVKGGICKGRGSTWLEGEAHQSWLHMAPTAACSHPRTKYGRPAAVAQHDGRAELLQNQGSQRMKEQTDPVAGRTASVSTAPFLYASRDEREQTRPSSAEERKGLQWTKNWYAVAAEEDIDTTRPYAIIVLGKRLVVWKDNNSTWRCFVDRCPHRCAPLSEGRIEAKDGSLQCTYHGWQFGPEGKPTCIPQLELNNESEEEKVRALQNPRNCVKSFPVRVERGLLFVWPDDSPTAFIDSAASSPYISPELDLVPPEERYRMIYAVCTRDLPIAYELAMENISDQSHVHFAHHKVASKGRDSPHAGYFKLWDLNKDIPPDAGFSYKLQWSPNGVQQPFNFLCLGVAPVSIEFRTIEEGREPSLLQFYLTPMTAHSVRTINIFMLMAPKGFLGWLASKVPRFIAHTLLNEVLDGDLSHLCYQDYNLHEMGAVDNQWSRGYSLPAAVDKPVAAWRRWFHTVGGNGPFADDKSTPTAVESMNKEQMLDRFEQHTKHCASCSKVLSRLETGQPVFNALALALGGLGLATASQRILLLLSAVLAAAASLGLHKWEREFRYKGYDHPSRP